jgi:hypothetical protein
LAHCLLVDVAQVNASRHGDFDSANASRCFVLTERGSGHAACLRPCGGRCGLSLAGLRSRSRSRHRCLTGLCGAPSGSRWILSATGGLLTAGRLARNRSRSRILRAARGSAKANGARARRCRSSGLISLGSARSSWATLESDNWRPVRSWATSAGRLIRASGETSDGGTIGLYPLRRYGLLAALGRRCCGALALRGRDWSVRVTCRANANAIDRVPVRPKPANSLAGVRDRSLFPIIRVENRADGARDSSLCLVRTASIRSGGRNGNFALSRTLRDWGSRVASRVSGARSGAARGGLGWCCGAACYLRARHWRRARVWPGYASWGGWLRRLAGRRFLACGSGRSGHANMILDICVRFRKFVFYRLDSLSHFWWEYSGVE